MTVRWEEELRAEVMSQAELKALYEGTWAPATARGPAGSLLPPAAMLGGRVLVCGGRGYSNWSRLSWVMNEMHGRVPIEFVIEGECHTRINADKLARRWAELRGITVLPFPADWKGPWGHGAGPRRNLQMLSEGRPDVVVAFPGGSGTRDMVHKAKFCGYPVIDLRYETYGWAGSP